MLCDDCRNKVACRFYIASFENVNHPLNDPYYKDAFYCDEHCVDKKPVTNGDRIRAMTDEELAEALSNAIHCRTCYARNVCKISADSNCQQDHLTWLKQPVKEDA